MDNTACVIDMSLHQVVGDLSLPVDHHHFAVGVPGKINSLKPAIECNINPLMDKSLLIHASTRPGFTEEISHALFDNPRTDSSQHIIAAATLQNNRINPLQMQQPPQQQSGRTRTNDAYLCSHLSLPWNRTACCSNFQKQASGFHNHALRTTGFRKTPIFSISTSTTSPSFKKIGGVRLKPTPSGVPVAMMSPASKVINRLM